MENLKTYNVGGIKYQIPSLIDRLTEKELNEFDNWKDETNYCCYDGMDRLIDLHTRKLYSFDEVYQKFRTEQFMSSYTPPEIEEIEQDAREDEARAAIEWINREEALREMNPENYYL